MGGHSIPLNRGALITLHTVGVISDDEFSKGVVPGLERAVPKNKGAEVGSLLHQLGVEIGRNPYGPNARKLMLEIDPSCKDRLPKKPVPKPDPPPAPPEPPKPTAAEPKKAAADAKKKAAAAKQRRRRRRSRRRKRKRSRRSHRRSTRPRRRRPHRSRRRTPDEERHREANDAEVGKAKPR